MTLPGDPNGYTLDEYRAAPFKHAQSPEARAWMRETGGTLPPFPLTQPSPGLHRLAADYDQELVRLQDVIAKLHEDVAYQTDRANHWARLANERQDIINRITGG